ncbi:phage tail protein [uncultured Helicobacter sp.]|uniref:phage tail protein n=1 Tax=uncultured Helicobacter sp. TaxID=175537 RepID=UPI00374F52C1
MPKSIKSIQSVLNNQFSKELNALDAAFGKLLDSIFVLESPYFYTPNAHNTQLIANTFDIDIQDEQDHIATKLIEKPILKKTKLGTYNGIKEVIEPIFGAVDIQTHATNERLEPFTFSIAIEPSSSNIMDLKKAQELINQYKPLRDNSAGISINFPQAEIPIEIAAFATLNMQLANTQGFILKRDFEIEVKGSYDVVAKWDFRL